MEYHLSLFFDWDKNGIISLMCDIGKDVIHIEEKRTKEGR